MAPYNADILLYLYSFQLVTHVIILPNDTPLATNPLCFLTVQLSCRVWYCTRIYSRMVDREFLPAEAVTIILGLCAVTCGLHRICWLFSIRNSSFVVAALLEHKWEGNISTDLKVIDVRVCDGVFWCTIGRRLSTWHIINLVFHKSGEFLE